MEGAKGPPSDNTKKGREGIALTALRTALLVAQLGRLIFWYFNCH